jgi:hypothetical protein
MTAIFQPEEAVSVGRIRLRRLTPEALNEMQDWLALSLAPDWPEYALEAATEQGEAVLIEEANTGSAIGAGVAILDAPQKGTAAIPFISIDPNRRYRGLGGEATLALERHLRSRFDLENVYAPIPDWRGLAVYFWLRQGYRPVTSNEAPWPLTGLVPEPRPGIWMLRDTA